MQGECDCGGGSRGILGYREIPIDDSRPALKLYPFQERAISDVEQAIWSRRLVRAPTGAGKTAIAVSVGNRVGAKRILVVTRAIVRRQWRDELDLWWPDHPRVGILEVGRKRTKGLSKRALAEKELAYQAPIQIVSYALLEHVEDGPWDLIVFDEVHTLQGTTTKVTQHARRVVNANPGKAVLGLSATPIPNDVCNIWQPIDILWPLRFGQQSKLAYVPYKFAVRYSLPETRIDEDTGEVYGTIYKGLNPLHADELRARIAAVTTQISKEEVNQYLPPLRVQLLRIKPEREVAFENIEDWKEANGRLKEPSVREWVDGLSPEDGNVCIGCYLRETAERLGNILRGSTLRPVTVVTGDEPPATRNETITKAIALGNSIIVATIHSVGIGIDSLANCSHVLLAELYDRACDLTQFLGRFHRLSTKNPVLIQILAIEGTRDEKIAMSLKRKEEEIGKLLKQDLIEEQFVAAVAKTEEDLVKEMLAVFAQEEDDDV